MAKSSSTFVVDNHCTLAEDEEWMCNLHFVRSDIDPTTVNPIAPRQLASLVNEFLIRSADILNKFCAQFENRMVQLDIRLDTFERMLALLERKLENIQSEETNKPSEEGKETPRGTEGMTAREEKEQETSGGETMGEQRTDETKEKETPAEGTVRAKEHPKVAKYFKMLKMGVPEAAVRQKMKSEGVDNALLNDPEKPMALTSRQIRLSPPARDEESENSCSTTEE